MASPAGFAVTVRVVGLSRDSALTVSQDWLLEIARAVVADPALTETFWDIGADPYMLLNVRLDGVTLNDAWLWTAATRTLE